MAAEVGEEVQLIPLPLLKPQVAHPKINGLNELSGWKMPLLENNLMSTRVCVYLTHLQYNA